MLIARVRLCLQSFPILFALHLASASLPVLVPTASGPGWERYEMVISIARDAPDCFQRTVVLVNGMGSPILQVRAGTQVDVVVVNAIPEDFPSVYNGITIHWHGFPMHGSDGWYDGVAYADQCPIPPGKNFTYSFTVNTAPGTYFYHDHSFAWKGDGLQGPLVVLPPAGGPAEPWQYDGEHVLMIDDWWHTESNVLAMRLNRPWDPAKVTNDTGKGLWVDLPQAFLINGNGYYGDCQLFPSGYSSGPPTCNVSAFTVPPGRSAAQPWASDTNPGCTHESFVVQPGSTYRFRIIGAGEMVYSTVCFEGHSVQVIAADAIPIEPFYAGCVDVNVGQRYDVLLTANNTPGNYWISVHQQYRLGAPSGYAVLSYASASSGQASPSLPLTPTPQPGVVPPWSNARVANLTLKSQLLKPAPGTSWGLYQDPNHDLPSLALPQKATRVVHVDVSQPILNATGMLRWALNDVVMPTSPVCEAYRTSILRNPKWEQLYASTKANPSVLGVAEGVSGAVRVYEYGKAPIPTYPSVGLQFVNIENGDVVDVVLQNNAANAFHGDYRNSSVGTTRTAQEQHPFHLHGHRFWVLGTGDGLFDPYNTSYASQLNLLNPVFRDTVTLPKGGWTVIRFLANNPGAWPLHCHILWHHFMGQQLHFIESPSLWPPQPRGFPSCPRQCSYNTNPFTPGWVQARYGRTGYPLP